ncbi:MAG TPA: DUF2339 domain-containing protein, partial [Solirubrobacteraceae bacterium]|nr:DUF2339 domain-containing protein [Solirubrobacteraceae bacterium]
GIVLFLALAISHGWIGQTARVLLAGGGSAVLIAAGAWLHARRGPTEAATTFVGAGTAGLFATLVVAGDVYRLAPSVVCVGGSLAVGGLATLLAIRWAGQAIGGLGLGGGLVAPILVGAPSDVGVLAMLLVAGACAMYVVGRQRWHWLGLATVGICAPQWAGWALAGQSAVPELILLAGFGGLGLAGGLVADRGSGSADPRWSIALVSVNACLAGVVGYVGLGLAGGHTLAVVWLVGLAGAHAGAAVTRRFGRVSPQTRQLLLTLAAVLADVAFGLTAHGILLTIGWAAVGVGLAWWLRGHPGPAGLVELGLGGHIGLVLIRVVLAQPPDSVVSTGGSLVGLLSISTLAASGLAAGHLSGRTRPAGRAALNAVGLLAIAYLTAGAVHGAGLTVAWAVEGLALIRIGVAGRDDGQTPWLGGLAFLGLAGLHGLVLDAPPAGLLTGTDRLWSAGVGLAAIGGASFMAGRLHPPASPRRRALVGAAAISLLYLASIVVVTIFQPAAAGPVVSVVDLPAGQQSQVALSILWSLAGLAGLTVGLRDRLPALRTGGLVLLLVTVVKVFAYDLSALDSIYRVVSLLTLGLLLLAAALTYQRLRPPGRAELPDQAR